MGVKRFTKDIEKVKQPTPKISFKYLSTRNSFIYITGKKFLKLNARQKVMEIFIFRNTTDY